MALVLIIAVALWGLGWALRVPIRTRVVMLALLYGAVLVLHTLLPAGHPLRAATGGSAAPWLLLGGFAALALLYRQGLMMLKARARPATAAPTTPDKPGKMKRAQDLHQSARSNGLDADGHGG